MVSVPCRFSSPPVTVANQFLFRRQINPHRRARARLARNRHAAAVVRHDAVNQRQAEAAMRLALGGEKRLENPRQHFRVNALAVVRDLHADVSARPRAARCGPASAPSNPRCACAPRSGPGLPSRRPRPRFPEFSSTPAAPWPRRTARRTVPRSGCSFQVIFAPWALRKKSTQRSVTWFRLPGGRRRRLLFLTAERLRVRWRFPPRAPPIFPPPAANAATDVPPRPCSSSNESGRARSSARC